MLIGIIETGKTAKELVDRFGRYPAMFEHLVGRQDPRFRFRTYVAVDGDVPSDPHDCDAWLITGSRHGVYDRLPWMAPLGALIRRSIDADVPVVGICFGHQIVADALGGKVVKSDNGWGAGIHDYDIIARPSWMADAPDTFAINAMHQDQVVGLPTGARVLARSEFCPFAALAYDGVAFTLQGHPEFDNDFARALIDVRLKHTAPADVRERARQSLARAPDSELVGRWIADFLRMAVARHSNTASSAGKDAAAQAS